MAPKKQPAVSSGKGTPSSKAVSKKLAIKKQGPPSHSRKRRSETFSVYIYRVLKQVHPETGISKRSMQIMNSFI